MHQKWPERMFQIYIRRLIKKHFHSLRIIGDVPLLDKKLPAVILPTHSTWWDGFFIYLLNDRFFKRRLFMMMLNEQLQNLRFFSRLGAYGIEKQNPKKILEGLRYTLGQLNDENLICIFPQGEITPVHQRPIILKRGITWILKYHTAPVQLLPVALYAELGEHQRPDVYIRFGQAMTTEAGQYQVLGYIAAQQERSLNTIFTEIQEDNHGTLLLRGRRSVNEKIDRLRGKAVS